MHLGCIIWRVLHNVAPMMVVLAYTDTACSYVISRQVCWNVCSNNFLSPRRTDALSLHDLSGKTPVEVARSHGQYACANRLEKLINSLPKRQPPILETVESNAVCKVARATGQNAQEPCSVEVYRYGNLCCYSCSLRELCTGQGRIV